MTKKKTDVRAKRDARARAEEARDLRDREAERRRNATLPPYKSIVRTFDRLGPERSGKQSAKDRTELINAIGAARAKGLLRILTCFGMTVLTQRADYTTGLLHWSNDQWCDALGLKKGKRVRVRENGQTWVDKSPMALRVFFRDLIRTGFAERIRLEARNDEDLKYGSEAWEHGIMVTRRLVYDERSFWRALNSSRPSGPGGAAPAVSRSGAPPLHEDRGRPRCEHSGTSSSDLYLS